VVAAAADREVAAEVEAVAEAVVEVAVVAAAADPNKAACARIVFCAWVNDRYVPRAAVVVAVGGLLQEATAITEGAIVAHVELEAAVVPHGPVHRPVALRVQGRA
jgi:hypothetical protein